MSSTMITELDEVAMTYAQSLFELAGKGGAEQQESIGQQTLDIAALLASDAKFRGLIASRIIPAADRTQSVERIFKGRVDDLLFKFIMLLCRKGRMEHFSAIAAGYQRLMREKHGHIEVTVTSAAPLSGEDASALRSQVQAKLQREPQLRFVVDATMLGGLRLQIGDKLIDGSLQARLRQMTRGLTERGLPAIRASAERAFLPN